MKKLLLIAACIACVFTAKSQTYHAFKVDVGFGYAIPSASGSSTKAGVTFTIQPHYRVSDDFAVGLRLEGAALAFQTSSSSDDTKVAVLASYCATGEYYLMGGGFRPFIGAGAGFFTQSSININNSSYTVPSATKFGFFPEVGVEAGHFRLSADYDILPDKAGYLAFKIGFFLGGGKK
jgi:opacity protein-like surface antigen